MSCFVCWCLVHCLFLRCSPKYHKLLDPRRVRAELKGPVSLQQAEHITGTHLYAYLQDSFLSAELVKCKLDSTKVVAGTTTAATHGSEGGVFTTSEEKQQWREIIEVKVV